MLLDVIVVVDIENVMLRIILRRLQRANVRMVDVERSRVSRKCRQASTSSVKSMVLLGNCPSESRLMRKCVVSLIRDVVL